MAYSDWLRHALVGRGKWTATTHATDSSNNGRPFLLVFLTRNNNNLKRRMSNEAELVQRLRREATPNRPARAVQVVELSGLPVAEQFRVVMAADGIVGTHGAGLTWLLALSGQCSTIVEIQAEGNYHYENLAYLFGKPHVFAPGTQWGAQQFTAKIAAVVDRVDVAESRWRRCVGELVSSSPSMSMDGMPVDGMSADSMPHENQLSQTMQASAGPPWKYFDYHQAALPQPTATEIFINRPRASADRFRQYMKAAKDMHKDVHRELYVEKHEQRYAERDNKNQERNVKRETSQQQYLDDQKRYLKVKEQIRLQREDANKEGRGAPIISKDKGADPETTTL